MKRFISSLAMLAVIALIGCEKHESPVAPPSQEQQVKSTPGIDVKASTAQLKEKVEAWKAQVEERDAALKIQAAKQRQLQSSIPQVAGGSKITVPSSSYPTIQSAVDAAAPGTKIIVKDGTYTGVVFVFKDNLTITAAHAGQAHIIGAFSYDGVTGGKLEGFVITGDYPSGVFLAGCTAVEIKENEVTGYLGIVLYASVDCVVKDNNVHEVQGGLTPIVATSGITIFLGGKHLVKGNDVHDNLVGIIVVEGLAGDVGSSPGKNEISSNKCNDNFYGLALFASEENDLGDNECNNNVVFGIYLLVGTDRNKIGSDNEANHNGIVGIFLDRDCDGNLVKKNEAHDNVGCDAVDLGTGNTFIENDFGTFNCAP